MDATRPEAKARWRDLTYAIFVLARNARAPSVRRQVDDYCSRRTAIGLTFEARIAGMAAATVATSSTTPAAAA